MGRIINTSPVSFYINASVSEPFYQLPVQIPTNTPGPIYAKIKNIGASTLTVSSTAIIFYYGQPGLGSPYTVATISPNQTKYFIVGSRYFPTQYVVWNVSDIIFKNPGSASIKKQNQTILKPNAIISPAITYGNQYIFKGGTPNTIGTVFDYLQFQIGPLATADVLVIGFKNPLGNYSFNQYFYSSSLNRWTRNIFGTPDATNTILTEDAIILINLRNTYKEISIPSGSIIQKLDNGKVFLNKK